MPATITNQGQGLYDKLFATNFTFDFRLAVHQVAFFASKTFHIGYPLAIEPVRLIVWMKANQQESMVRKAEL